MIQSWLVKRLFGWVLGRLRAGDIRPVLFLDHPEVEMTFPGDNSFSGVIRGRAAHRVWLQRLVDMGLQNHVDEVVAVGPPWRMTVSTRGYDFARSADGELIYENRYVMWMHLRWGRLCDYEVYEDTHKAERFDTWLAEHRPELAVA